MNNRRHAYDSGNSKELHARNLGQRPNLCIFITPPRQTPAKARRVKGLHTQYKHDLGKILLPIENNKELASTVTLGEGGESYPLIIYSHK